MNSTPQTTDTNQAADIRNRENRIRTLLVILLSILIGIVIGMADSGQASTTSGNATSISIPPTCLSSTATHRTYPLNIPAGDTYFRSGEHGHGKLTCIIFMTRTYSKVLTINTSTGGYTIPASGLDASYFDCGLPGFHFPPNNIDNGPNDCADTAATTEGNWVYPKGDFDAGQPMTPSTSP